MKLLFDFFPILLFFIGYKVYGIYIATLITMIASAFQVLIQRIRYKTFQKMHLISLGIILVLGSATLFFHNPWFIKLKPTGIYWLFGLVIAGSVFIGEKTITQRMLENNVNLPARIWPRLNWAWALYCLFLGTANLLVALFFSENTWVNFKLFGSLGITLLFVIIQSIYLSKHMSSKEDILQKTIGEK